MRDRLARVALAGSLWLGLVAAAAAQTQPMPVQPEPEAEPGDEAAAPLPPPPPPLLPAGPGGAGIVARSRPRPWQYGLGMGLLYESNIGFDSLQGGAELSGFAVSPRGSVTRVFWSPRWQLQATADGQWRGYPQHSSLNRYYTNGSLDGSYRASPATAWNAHIAYGFGYTDSVRILAEQGVQLPLAKTQNLGAWLGVVHRLGPRMSLRVSAGGNRTTFDQAPPPAPQLNEGQSARVTTGIDRRLGARDTAGIEYSMERTQAGTGSSGRHYLTHFGSLQWSHVLTPRSGLLLDAGASYTPQSTLAGLRQPAGFFGGASYNRKVKRSTLTAFLRREVTPAFGTGVSRLEDRLGLTAALPIGQRWQLMANGTHVQPHAPSDASSTNAYGRSDDAAFTLSRRLGRRIDLSAQGSYRRYSGTPVAATDTYQIGAFVSLVNP